MRKTLATIGLATMMVLSIVGTAFAVSATMGNDATLRGNVDGYHNFTIVDTNNPAPFDGVFNEITYYAARTGDVRFVIVDSNDEVAWVSDVITATSAGVHTVRLPGPVGVTAGSNLGVYSVNVGVVSWEYDVTAAGAAWEPNNAGLPTVGDTLNYEATTQGRNYSMNVTISATSPDICKDSGWESYGYKNQGQCIASVVADEHADKS
jgi:hypothetical protein